MVNLPAFLAVAALLVITPGPDTAVVTKNALSGGRRAALLSSLGIELGLASQATAILSRSRVRTAISRFTGCVLVGFGLRLATERR